MIHDLFRAYKADPTKDSLLALLRGVQDLVYSLCFHVLRHSQDAEDASQTVLLKILDVLPRLTEAEHFRSLLVRMAFQVSLNAAEKRRARIRHEARRAGMSHPSPSAEEALALHRAIADLEEDLQTLVVARYFECKSLDAIAAERGCSTSAVWKRIERSKEALRLALGSALAVTLEAALDAATFSPAPRDLLTSPVLEKAERVARRSGRVLGTKGSLVGFSALLFGLTLGIGGLLIARRSDPSGGPTPPPRLTNRRDGASEPTGPHPPAEVRAVAADPEDADLRTALRRLGALILEARAADPSDPATPDLYRRAMETWRALRPLVLADLDPFFAALREPDHRTIFKDLLALLYGHELGPTGWWRVPSDEVPAAAADRLCDLLVSGTLREKGDLVDPMLAGAVGAHGKEFLWKGIRQNLVSETDPRVLNVMLIAVVANVVDRKALLTMLEADLELVRRLWTRTSDESVRGGCLLVLSHMSGAVSESLFVEKTEEMIRIAEVGQVRMIPRLLLNRLGAVQPAGGNPYLPIFRAAFHQVRDADSFLAFVNAAAMSLPPNHLTAVLEEAQPRAPDPEIDSGLRRMLALLRSGETNSDAVRRAYRESR